VYSCGPVDLWALSVSPHRYECLGDMQAAITDVEHAALLEPTNKHVKRQLARLRKMVATQKRKLQAAYGRAFSGGGADSEGASKDAAQAPVSLYPERHAPRAQPLVPWLLGYVRTMLWLLCSPLRWTLTKLAAVPTFHMLLALLAALLLRVPVLGWVGKWLLDAGCGPILQQAELAQRKQARQQSQRQR